MKKVIIILLFLILFLGLFYYYHISKSKTLKIGFVTDWESGNFSNNEKNGKLTKELLTKTVSNYNYFFKPDLVVAGGDYLGKNAENPTENLRYLKELLVIFDKIRATKIYCLGKKDYKFNSLEEVKNVLNIRNTYYSQTIKGIKILILDTTQNDEPESTKGTISQEQLQWLEKELNQTEPVIIFSHHSLIETPDEDLWRNNLTNQTEILNLLKNNKNKIIFVASGNIKKDYVTKESGIPFLNISGLNGQKTLGRSSEIKLDFDKKNPNLVTIDLKNNGKNGAIYEIKRNLETSTDTRITLIKETEISLNRKWFDLEDSSNLSGILSDGAGGEPNLNVTKKNGYVVAAFENKNLDGKIQVKINKNNKWFVLSDANHPDGLISLGKGSNPVIETRNDDIFVTFVESDHNERVRLLEWSDEQQVWKELSPQGFISENPGHEPTLVFDKKKENLYLAYAEKIRSDKEQTQAIIKKWNGQNWETITTSLLVFADNRTSSVDEFDLVASRLDDSIYLTYEEIKDNGKHGVRVKKWDGLKWNNLIIDKLYFETISQVNGFSPSLTIDKKDNLYLTFVENNGGKIHIYKYNKNAWQDLGTQLASAEQKAIEPYIEIDDKNVLYLAYSDYKEDVVIALNNGKNTGEELTKASAWRVKVQKFENDHWANCEDDLNYNGYISKGSGKGDPSLKIFDNDLFIIFSDEANNGAPRVKKYLIK